MVARLLKCVFACTILFVESLSAVSQELPLPFSHVISSWDSISGYYEQNGLNDPHVIKQLEFINMSFLSEITTIVAEQGPSQSSIDKAFSIIDPYSGFINRIVKDDEEYVFLMIYHHGSFHNQNNALFQYARQCFVCDSANSRRPIRIINQISPKPIF